MLGVGGRERRLWEVCLGGVVLCNSNLCVSG